jgi:methionyl-tRNA formyltransferase
MRLALLYADGNFVGREYYAAMLAAGLEPVLVASVGRMEPESITREVERTGGRWNPPAIPDRAVAGHFTSTRDSGLAKSLRDAEIDVAIQGGVGILKKDMLSLPRIGWLNVHPGRLPQYRGNACPEWAILNGDPVVATAHLIDEGIDTGPIICAAPYEIAADWSYFDFRANLYRHCAGVLLQAIALINGAPPGAHVATRQPEEGARYWPPLDETGLAAVRARFPLGH